LSCRTSFTRWTLSSFWSTWTLTTEITFYDHSIQIVECGLPNHLELLTGCPGGPGGPCGPGGPYTRWQQYKNKKIMFNRMLTGSPGAPTPPPPPDLVPCIRIMITTPLHHIIPDS